MLKGFIVGVVVTLLVIVIGGAAYVQFGFLPANADAKPGKLETWVAKRSLHAAIARGTVGVQNPLQPDDATLAAGEKIYATHCSFCHGASAKLPTYTSVGLYQHAPTFGMHVGHDPDAEFYWKVTHGVRFTGMPSFGTTLSDTQRWQVVTFLKNLDKLPPDVRAKWMKLSAPTVPPSLVPPEMLRHHRPPAVRT